MNEMKKFYIAIGIIAVICVVLFISIFTKNDKNLVSEIDNAINGDNKTLIYVGRPTCGYCNLLTPSLEDMKKRYNFDYIYVNVDEVSSPSMKQIAEKIKMEEIATPYLAIVGTGEVLSVHPGYGDYDEIFYWLQSNNIIDSAAKLLLNYIDYDGYISKLKEDKLNIFVIGQSTCIHCINSKIELNKVADANNTEINYINLSYFTEEEIQLFISSLPYLSAEWSGGTPTTMITKNGELIDTLIGETTSSKFAEFFEKNGVL